MGDTTEISWCDKTFNPWRGCSKVSPGCAGCYAARHESRFGSVKWGPTGTRVVTSDANWKQPLKWDRDASDLQSWCATYRSVDAPRPRVFCASLSDVFEDWQGFMVDSSGDRYIVTEVGDLVASHHGPGQRERLATIYDVRHRLFEMIDSTPNLDWLLLTKRPENIQHMWPDTPVGAAERDAYFPYPPPGGFRNRDNVWIGTSVENSDYLHRIDTLKSCGDLAGKLFLSIEPLLGPLPTLGEHLDGIDWVIVGGESGPNSRPMNPDWVRSIRDQCETHGVPFHFKQFGEWIPYEHCGSPPLIESQHGFNFDSHDLPEGIIDHEPVNGWYWPDGLSDVVYRRVGKKIAGRKLDGVTHDAFP